MRKLILMSVMLAACSESTAPSIPARVLVTGGGNQTAEVGTPTLNPVYLRVEDERGRGVPDASVQLTTNDGTTVLSAITDQHGSTSAYLTMGPKAGAVRLVARSGSLVGDAVEFTATPAQATRMEFAQNPTHTDAGTPVSARVRGLDRFGNVTARLDPVSATVVGATFADGTTTIVRAPSEEVHIDGMTFTKRGAYFLRYTSGTLPALVDSLFVYAAGPVDVRLLSEPVVSRKIGQPTRLDFVLVDEYGNESRREDNGLTEGYMFDCAPPLAVHAVVQPGDSLSAPYALVSSGFFYGQTVGRSCTAGHINVGIERKFTVERS